MTEMIAGWSILVLLFLTAIKARKRSSVRQRADRLAKAERLYMHIVLATSVIEKEAGMRVAEDNARRRGCGLV